MKRTTTQCPNCGGQGHQIRRTGYLGHGAEMVGYPIEVMSCNWCRREWVDAALGRANAVQVEAARRMVSGRSSPFARLDEYS
jgi:hypothetical protein